MNIMQSQLARRMVIETTVSNKTLFYSDIYIYIFKDYSPNDEVSPINVDVYIL